MNRRAVLTVALLAVAGAAVAAGTMFRTRWSDGSVGGDSTRFGFGRRATGKEIAALDIDVRADGTGLPRGSGTAKEGAAVYLAKCAGCHGPTGVEGPNDVLVTKEPGKGIPGPGGIRTVGNYWGYATTLYDYVHRAMPQVQPGSLAPNEVYSLVAWILWRNRLIAEDQVMDRVSLPKVKMPAQSYYYADPRPANLIP